MKRRSLLALAAAAVAGPALAKVGAPVPNYGLHIYDAHGSEIARPTPLSLDGRYVVSGCITADKLAAGPVGEPFIPLR